MFQILIGPTEPVLMSQAFLQLCRVLYSYMGDTGHPSVAPELTQRNPRSISHFHKTKKQQHFRDTKEFYITTYNNQAFSTPPEGVQRLLLFAGGMLSLESAVSTIDGTWFSRQAEKLDEEPRLGAGGEAGDSSKKNLFGHRTW